MKKRATRLLRLLTAAITVIILSALMTATIMIAARRSACTKAAGINAGRSNVRSRRLTFDRLDRSGFL